MPRPSEMWQRGRQDAEADALDENYYHYYYDYRLAYDEVMRNRRRTRLQIILRRTGRQLLWILPILLLVGGIAFVRYRPDLRLVAGREPSPTATRTPRPTLPPPTPRPSVTPTAEPVLRADGFAVISGTTGAPLRVRRGPGQDSAIVTRLAEGKTVKLLEGPQEANGMEWWRIEVEGTTGWAAAPYLKAVPPPQ